jgi:hypothetical protein
MPDASIAGNAAAAQGERQVKSSRSGGFSPP